MRAHFRRLAILVLLSCSACGALRSTSESGSSGDRNLLTREQLLAGNFSNAFDAVRALRPTWLQTRGVDSIRNPTQVHVYLDDSRLGDINELRTIGVVTISYIRYIDGLAASARWGLGHGQGVIYVRSGPR